MGRFLLTLVVVAIISTVDGKSMTEREEVAEVKAYYVDDGCHDASFEKVKTDDFKGFYQPENLKAGVRCCSLDGESIIEGNNNGKERFCKTLGKCTGNNGVTFKEAGEQCAAEGLRLCTKEELLSEECCGTGGNCDSHLVWTSTLAKYYVDDGCHDASFEKVDTDDFEGFYQASDLKAGVRCCSIDATTIIHADKGRWCTTLGPCNANNGVTFFEAGQQCAAKGYRLCTKTELMSDQCCGTGGNCDSHLVWTSTDDVPDPEVPDEK